MKCLDSEDALELIMVAKVESLRIGVPMSLAVVDAAGHPLLAERMVGAGWLTADIAYSKAFTAAAWRIATVELQSRLSNAPYLVNALSVQTRGSFMPQGGGIPVVREGQIVGALGASGGSAAQDHGVAQVGVEAFIANSE